MTNKQKYIQLCATEQTIPLFSQNWWLDAVCGELNWDVVLVERSGVIVATMPYYFYSRYGFCVSHMPPLTQTLGPWLKTTNLNYTKKLNRQHEIMAELISKLPAFNSFSQNWYYTVTNWLPFYWQGFQNSTLYTYILTDLTSEDQLFNEFRPNIRTEIRKARDRNQLKVRTDLGLADFLKLNKMTFKRKSMELPYTEKLVEGIDQVCVVRKKRMIFIAEDEQGRHHAGLYLVWHNNEAYVLMIGGDPNLYSSGATALCVWEAIKYSAKVVTIFNFEGSMLQSVEPFFRGFGSIQTPYFKVFKTDSILLRTRQVLKTIFRG
jgi:hypothetical protein